MSELDALAVGPHPDDVELFCGGTVIRLGQLGYRVGVLDLTEGELASNGTVTARRQEAAAAAEVMGAVHRENLRLPDGGLHPGTDAHQLRVTAGALRRLRPRMLLAPWLQARHPDHAAAGALLRRAVFAAGLKNFETEPAGEPFRVGVVLFYMMRHRFSPTFIVDTSLGAEKKRAAILCHTSQVGPRGPNQEHQGETVAGDEAPSWSPTLVGSAGSLTAIDARDRHYGSYIGVSHGEPFRTENTLGLADPFKHFLDNPFDTAYAFEAFP